MPEAHRQPGSLDLSDDPDKHSSAVVSDNDVGRNLTTSADDEEPITADAQAGVQNIEAVTSVWTTTALVVAYVMIWFIYFFDMMHQGVSGALTPYVTSAFQHHSLTPTVGIMSSIIGGVFKLTIAKILDVFGRPQGYILSLFLATIGLVMMAACNNVETYAAAQVFYTVGNNAMLYCITIFIADTSSLRNRGLMIAYSGSPNIITTWLAGPMSEAYLKGPGWRWCWGTFAIIIPVVASPLFFLFLYNQQKARKRGLIVEHKSGRTLWQSLAYYCREFDAVGLLLLSAGLALFLLPFHIYSMQDQQWRSPLIICLLVFGITLIIAFAAWEKFFASITFIPYDLLLDRTVLGACVLAATLFVSFFCWNSYFNSFLQVVNTLSVTHASYVSQVYTVGSALWCLVAGLIIRRTGRYKAICLYFALPLSVLGMGLMIHFRKPNVNIGYIVMTQIFISFASGTIIICDQIAAMAAASHQHIAVVLAIESMFSEIGGAVGLTVAAAIWQGVFPQKLAEYLPTEELPNLVDIYGALEVQLSYPEGSPARVAIQHAYVDAQKMMLIAGTAVWAVGFVATVVWRDINVKDIKQVKGHVI
ncbi:Siderophore iron transporter mirB [Fusarium albosuccineum]|uniref:Siderophore iron transporter mirB n=1 Tax=Fusarium albosuccineum TaxID=1237068 RepID=A0A8H4LPJ5_9HYPO|nr:Siderophore iron transporter mirB [Fusarium albosuccineum]